MSQTQVEELLLRLDQSIKQVLNASPVEFKNNIKIIKAYLEKHQGTFELFYVSVIVHTPHESSLIRALIGEERGDNTRLSIQLGFSVFCTECNEQHYKAVDVLNAEFDNEADAFYLARNLKENL